MYESKWQKEKEQLEQWILVDKLSLKKLEEDMDVVVVI